MPRRKWSKPNPNHKWRHLLDHEARSAGGKNNRHLHYMDQPVHHTIFSQLAPRGCTLSAAEFLTARKALHKTKGH